MAKVISIVESHVPSLVVGLTPASPGLTGHQLPESYVIE